MRGVEDVLQQGGEAEREHAVVRADDVAAARAVDDGGDGARRWGGRP